MMYRQGKIKILWRKTLSALSVMKLTLRMANRGLDVPAAAG